MGITDVVVLIHLLFDSHHLIHLPYAYRRFLALQSVGDGGDWTPDSKYEINDSH